MAKKKSTRVHVECATPIGYRNFKRLAINDSGSPIAIANADSSITVLRPDRFANVLEATGCRVVETLKGAKRRRR